MEILLVEDNPGDIILIQSTFEDIDGTDIKMIAQTDGIMASTYINESSNYPDLVILDINLPYKNGFEILKEINSNDKYRNVPVIFFTSSQSEDDISNALKNGAKAFISKPIDLDEYQDQVRSFINFIHPV